MRAAEKRAAGKARYETDADDRFNAPHAPPLLENLDLSRNGGKLRVRAGCRIGGYGIITLLEAQRPDNIFAMNDAAARPALDADDIAPMPGWITPARAETPEDAAFLAGAALAHLHLMAVSHRLPQSLWRERLALEASVACAAFAGRREAAGDLRDAVHLLRLGDHPGPAGEIFRHWSDATARPLSATALGRALPGVCPDRIASSLKARGIPVARAASILEAVLAETPRAETAALILADAALARSMGWTHLVPLLATGLKPRDLRATGSDLRQACERAALSSARSATRMAADLARRADRLRTVAPKLRARNAREAVVLFLSRDALAPAALTHLMSDRAARRFCDRLVELDAVRELTGRDSFRLYGV